MKFFYLHYLRNVLVGCHLAIIVLSLVIGFWLRFDFSLPQAEVTMLLQALWIAAPLKMLVFHLARLHKDWSRFARMMDLFGVFWANAVASVAFTTTALVMIGPGFPRSIYFIDFLLCFFLTAGVRFAAVINKEIPTVKCTIGRSGLLRILADALIVSASLAIGLLARFWFSVVISEVSDPAETMAEYLRYFFGHGPLLLATILATFTVAGVYTKKRTYTRRYKFIAIAQAISISYGMFLLVAYLFSYGESFFVPRSAFLISYLLTMTGCIGARFLKTYVSDNFHIQPKRPSTNGNVQKVLVIGGAGYIGSVLVRQLLDAQYEVRVLDQLMFGDESIRQLYNHPAFELIHGDFRHVDAVVNAVKGMDAVIHLGAIVGDPACTVDEQTTLQTNYAATALVTDVCKGSGISRMIFASTCSVYGVTDHLVDEKSTLNPVSLYAATKIDSEKILLASKNDRFHPTILRLGTAFGLSYRPRFDLVVNLLTAMAYFDKKIMIYNGEQWRPFVHVTDISRAFRMTLETPLPLASGEIFNVGCYSLNHRLADVGELICQTVPDVDVAREGNSDARNYRVSFEKIQSVLGFTCQTSLPEGIKEIYEALEQGRVRDYKATIYHNHKFVAQNGNPLQGQLISLELAAGKFAKRQPLADRMLADV